MVPSHLFGFSRAVAIEHIVNKTMSDRVIPGVGLVLALWDILSLGDDRLVRHTGKTSTECRFRVVVFAPFVGETIPARIGPSTESGILTYTHFFNLIWVPRDSLPPQCSFDPNDQVWAWRPTVQVEEGEEEEGHEDDLGLDDFEGGKEKAKEEVVSNFMDGGNETVIRVTSVDYDEGGGGYSNVNHSSNDNNNNNNTSGADNINSNDSVAPRNSAQYSMVIKGSLYDEVIEDNQGLGDPAWWYEGDEGAEEEDEELGEEHIEEGEGANEAEGHDGEVGDAGGANEEDWGGAEDDDTGAQDEYVHDEGGEAAVDAEEEDE